VWALSNPTIVEHICISTEPAARQWLFSMMRTMEHDDFIRLVVTLWAIWHARRKAIHEDIYQSPQATHQFIESFLHDLSLSEKPRATAAAKVHPPLAPRWIPPPQNQSKVNTDGAVAKISNRGAVAAVCRSHAGVYLGSSAVVFEGITHPGCLEAMACREALALTADLGVEGVTVASDCMEVIQGLKGNNLGLFSHVLKEIKTSAEQRGGFCFRHESRRSNGEAHSLARSATSLAAGCHVWLGVIPPFLSFPVNILGRNE
jgi:ribonuclease HI